MSELQQEQLETQTSDNSPPTSQSQFPQTIVAVSREEFEEPIHLTVRDGTGLETKLSHDLHGHFFLVGPTGSVKSTLVEGDDSGNVVWVAKDGWTPLYNGDGMIYRFSFADGGATLKTRLVKPPCYYADQATADEQNRDRFEGLAFQNLGITRTSLNKLGLRNQLNTAFLPFKLPNDNSCDRLLVTWDVGRPYEIDPETLETLTPVGKNQDWSDLLPKQPPQPFKQVMSSAHPVFDPHTGELFTVNVGKSTWTMLALSRSLTERVAENAASLKSAIADSAFSQSIQGNLIKLYGLFLWLIQIIVGILGRIEKISI